MDDSVGSLDALLALADRDEAAGLGDAPWPPHFQKAEGEAPRVAPSRAKGAAKSRGEEIERRRANAEDAAHHDREFAEQARGARGTRAVESEIRGSGVTSRGRRRAR